ncbi:hypothetical protein PR003_g6752 [Phytophthora rubi]|uniref:RxLR effector protein n=1 Tax=Phytophthora rubi TaxID=129364 RepID=A0A6A4FPI8_9STRA|nr:hypothetical protein PR002_g6761 [Phytophthora rubi]KAE9043063.1 hypothetical protein PR001_g5939 [Phytophthora rubi]KAE9347800.1 hypothetical protein PR003_g6752 [Phytophthora rubi]
MSRTTCTAGQTGTVMLLLLTAPCCKPCCRLRPAAVSAINRLRTFSASQAKGMVALQ